MSTETVQDEERRAQFLERMTTVLNGGALTLMLSIGHRTGLFDTMAGLGPSTSEEIAEAAGLQERYVREWLGSMVCGGLVDHDAAAGTYHLPPEHSGLLTRAAGPLNMAAYGQFISLLGEVESDVVDAFRDGGGVPYDRYPRFQELMAEISWQRFQAGMVSQTVPLLPGGRAAFEQGLDMADVGCGSGRGLNLLAETFPDSRFTGYDLSPGGIAAARSEAERKGLTNVEFHERDVTALGEHDRFDLVTTFDAIHDQAHPRRVLTEIHAAVRPGGTYLCVEPKSSTELTDNVEHPMGAFYYSVSTMHCMTVSLAYDGEGLGNMWGHQLAVELLGEAGFVDIELTGIKADRNNNYFLCRKPA